MNSIQNLFNISEVGEAAVSSSSSGPASSLSAKMEAEGVRNGQVMFHPSDSFAVFVRAVESSVFAHLFETERDEAAEGKKPIKSSSSGGHERRAQQMNGASLSNREKDMEEMLIACARELVGKAKSLFAVNHKGEKNDTLFDEMNVYSVRPVAAIRMSIRVFIMECSPGPHVIFDVLDECFTALHEIDSRFNLYQEVGRGLRSYAKTLENLAHLHLHYMTLKDDPYADVLHFSSRHILSTSDSPLRVVISRCGTDFLHGEYIRSATDQELVSYVSMRGYAIRRTKQRIQEDVEIEDFVFVWYIVSEERQAAYYSCATAERSVIPPSYGWRTVDSGILPAPLVLMPLKASGSIASSLDEGSRSEEATVAVNNYHGKRLMQDEEAIVEDDDLHAFSVDCVLSEPDQVGLDQPQQSLDAPVNVTRLQRNRPQVAQNGQFEASLLELNFPVHSDSDNLLGNYENELSPHDDGEDEDDGAEEEEEEEEEEEGKRPVILLPESSFPESFVTGVLNEPFPDTGTFLASYDAACDDLRTEITSGKEKIAWLKTAEDIVPTQAQAVESKPAITNAFASQWTFTTVVEKYVERQREKITLHHSNLLNTLLEATIPDLHDSHAFAPRVKVLGIRRSSKDKKEEHNDRFRYVTRISVNNNRAFDAAKPDEDEDDHRKEDEDDISCGFDAEIIDSSASGVEKSTGDVPLPSGRESWQYAKRGASGEILAGLLEVLVSKIGLDDTLTSTISHDLNEFCNFHATLSKILADVDMHPPPFPDPFFIESVEERARQLSEAEEDFFSFSTAHRQALNATEREHIDCMNVLGEQLYLDLEGVFQSLQAYLVNVFAVVDSLLSAEIASSSVLQSQLIAMTREFMKIADKSCHVPMSILPQQDSMSNNALLERQKYRCAGCGEALKKNFLGLLGAQGSYAPCRHHGGLFCKRWCHAGTRAAIPHRILRDLDTDAGRVCEQSRDFLVSIMDKPVIDLSKQASTLVERTQILCFAREKRRQLVALLQRLDETKDGLLQQHLEATISQSVGLHRTYLCTSESLYSLQDLLSIRDGELVRSLTKMEKKLLQI